MPTGTLMKKIHGQESDCVSAPPSDQADRAAADRDRRPDAERLRALGAFLKVVVMIASAAGEMNAAPSPWSARQAISIPELCARPSSSDATVKTTRPNEEQPLAPEQVAGAAAEQQEAAEDERVGVDDPLEVRLREAEVFLDRRQRDVHDRRVEDDHELREADEDEDQPGVRRAASARHHCLPCHAPGVAKTIRGASNARCARRRTGHQ